MKETTMPPKEEPKKKTKAQLAKENSKWGVDAPPKPKNTCTPTALKLAQANGINIQQLDGGEDNRINVSEVKAAIKKRDDKLNTPGY